MHRDIKPENLMFSRLNKLDGLKIVDFGLSTMCNATEFLYLKCGTPGYVAPELANIKAK
jgi:calcium-dependent protein kinase